MHHFQYVDGQLFCEGVPLARIAEAVGTPTYVYSAATLRRHYQVMEEAFAPRERLICFSVKACSNLSVLRTLAEAGAGFDVVSGGELTRVLRAGGRPERVVFSGVGKTRDEMVQGLRAGILMFNVESAAEAELLSEVAADLGRPAPMAVRVNPDVDPRTHPHLATGIRASKFGVGVTTARAIYDRARKDDNLQPIGIDCHIGSQLVDLEPVRDGVTRVAALARELIAQGDALRYFDIGGGIGIPYGDRAEVPPLPATFGATIAAALGDLDVTVIAEPGRVIAGNAGVLLTRLLRVKEPEEQAPEKEGATAGRAKRFWVVDAAMNDLLRPSLYGGHHEVWPVGKRANAEPQRVDVVGPICESGDFLARERDIPGSVAGDLLAVMSAGAYGFTMSSNYNTRPRSAEVLVDADVARLVRRRERLDEMLALEEDVETL